MPRLCGACWSLLLLAAAACAVSARELQQQQLPADIELSNKSGLRVFLTPIGAAIHKLFVPVCNTGKSVDVALGFDDVKGYTLDPHPSFGATVGRVANRISGAQFAVGGKTYKLLANDGTSSIHGGAVRWSKAVWRATRAPSGRSVSFSYTSKDGEAGFPGNVEVTTTYSIPAEGLWINISMSATTDKATPINVLNHNYFNLKGSGNGDILDHLVQINSGYYTPSPPGDLLPTGQVFAAAGTIYDFSKPRRIGADVAAANGGPYRGFDLNYVMPSPAGSLEPVWWKSGVNPQTAPDAGTRPLTWGATVTEPKSGLKLSVYTSAPGLHFYSGNFLNDKDGSAGAVLNKGGIRYPQHAGFCFETQGFPNAANTPTFPSVIVRPGETFWNRVSYQFSC